MKTASKRKSIMKILSVIPAVAAVVVFLLTENLSQKMQYVDKWTVLMAVIAAVSVVMAVLALVGKSSTVDLESGEPGEVN